MSYIDLVSMLGYNNNALMMMEAFSGSSNIILTDNPEYTAEMFTCTFKNFCIEGCNDPVDGSEPIPSCVFNLFVGMAQASIKKDRYKSSWEYLMGLYIAHNLTLYLRASSGDPGATSALQGSLPVGIASSKSVDGLSIGYEFMGMSEDFSGYGTWILTSYGQQLITLTKMYGHAGMWVNG